MNNEKLPIELSADGKRNAYSHPCNVMGYRANFAVCIHLMEKRKEGRLSAIYSACSAAIGNKRCPAIKMRKEELEKGQAIYFEERNRSGAVINTAPTPSHNMQNKSLLTKKSTGRKKQPASTPKAADDFVDGGGIGDAINNAFDAEKERIEGLKKEAVETGKPIVTATQQPKVTPLPGESLLEIARRIMKLNKEKS